MGRADEIVQTKSLLEQSRLVTLGGPGGIGKTRLALEIAATWSGRVVTVPLETLAPGDSIFPSIAAALQIDVRGGAVDPAGAVVAALRREPALLILDNCERVIDACIGVAEHLVAATEHVRILATSRETLGIEGEAPLILGPLSEADAMQLFADRAAFADPDFTIDESNRHSVARMVESVDRLPLGIEIAAAAGAPWGSTLAHHRSLDAVVAWSYERLPLAERRLFARCAVFAGGWSEKGAAAVAGFQPLSQLEVPALLASLARRSLAIADGQTRRWRFLETTRDFAIRVLGESDEQLHLRDRHARHYRDLVEGMEGRSLRESWAAIEADLSAEVPNCAAALRWAMDHGNRTDGARLIASLVPYAAWTRMLPDDAQFLTIALEAAGGDVNLTARVEHAIAVRAMFKGAAREAVDHELAAIAGFRLSDDRPRLTRALSILARLQFTVGEIHAAVATGKEALALTTADATPALRMAILGNLEVHLRASGPSTAADAFNVEARELAMAIGDRRALVALLGNRGVSLTEEGRYREALEIARKATEYAEMLDDRRLLAWQLMNLGAAELTDKRYDAAFTALGRALRLQLEHEDNYATAVTLMHFAEIALERGAHDAAVRILACSDAVRGDSFALQSMDGAVREDVIAQLAPFADRARWKDEVEAAPRTPEGILALVLGAGS